MLFTSNHQNSFNSRTDISRISSKKGYSSPEAAFDKIPEIALDWEVGTNHGTELWRRKEKEEDDDEQQRNNMYECFQNQIRRGNVMI